jgi:hypothetical protein
VSSWAAAYIELRGQYRVYVLVETSLGRKLVAMGSDDLQPLLHVVEAVSK